MTIKLYLGEFFSLKFHSSFQFFYFFQCSALVGRFQLQIVWLNRLSSLPVQSYNCVGDLLNCFLCLPCRLAFSPLASPCGKCCPRWPVNLHHGLIISKVPGKTAAVLIA